MFEKKTLQNICYFHKFTVQYHLHEYYCTFEQLVGKTLIQIDSAVTKQTKHMRFCFFQNILSATIFFYRKRDIEKQILNLVLE